MDSTPTHSSESRILQRQHIARAERRRKPWKSSEHIPVGDLTGWPDYLLDNISPKARRDHFRQLIRTAIWAGDEDGRLRHMQQYAVKWGPECMNRDYPWWLHR